LSARGLFLNHQVTSTDPTPPRSPASPDDDADCEPGNPYQARDYADAAGALRQILAWVVAPINDGSKQHLRGVRNRAVALAWSINPDTLGGLSMSQLARKIGLHPQRLSAFTRAARIRFGVVNRYQRAHDWRRRRI